MNLTIFQKGVILTAIPLASQLLFTLLVAYLHEENTQAQREAAQSQRVLRQSQIVLRGVADAGTRSAGYILTGKPSFLKALELNRGQIPTVCATGGDGRGQPGTSGNGCKRSRKKSCGPAELARDQ